MTRNFIFFINPISGTKNKALLAPLITKRMAAAKLPFRILDTNKEADYSFLPALISKENITDIVICGGDGTVNQIAAALLKLDVNVGIVPMGSGNGLAFAAGIPANAVRALDIIIKGYAVYIDSFYINKQFSCMLCGLGFDAQVAHDFAKQKNRGLANYAKQTIKNFFRAPAYPFIIDVNNTQITTTAFFISIANSNQFGNNVTIAPRASLSDGLLDIIIVNKMNRISLLFSLLRQVINGKIVEVSDKGFRKMNIQYLHTRRLHIKNDGLAPLHIDGEPSKTSSMLDIEIIQKAFRLLQPSGK